MAMKKREVREKQQQEAAAKKTADEWKAKVDAEKALEEKRKVATTAGPEALKAFEEEYAAELEALKWTEEDEKAYWAEIKRINDEKKAAAAAEAKRRKKLTKQERLDEDVVKNALEEAKKVEDEAYELVETKVKLRGNGTPVKKVRLASADSACPTSATGATAQLLSVDHEACNRADVSVANVVMWPTLLAPS